MANLAAFTVGGVLHSTAAHSVSYSATVNLALVTTLGVNTITWRVAGTSQPGMASPTITPAGSPSGATASFPFMATPGDDVGRALTIECKVIDNGGNQHLAYAVIGVVGAAGNVPFVAGETDYRSSTHGVGGDMNTAIAAAATAGGGAAGAETLKSSVRLATIAALAAHSFVANVMTASANGALSVDGVAVTAGDRILVKNEAASHLQHGIYTVTATGSAGAPWVLTRATDWDASSEFETGSAVLIREGTQAGQIWYLSTTGAIVLNTTALTFLPAVIDADVIAEKYGVSSASSDVYSALQTAVNVAILAKKRVVLPAGILQFKLWNGSSAQQLVIANGDVTIRGQGGRTKQTQFILTPVAAVDRGPGISAPFIVISSTGTPKVNLIGFYIEGPQSNAYTISITGVSLTFDAAAKTLVRVTGDWTTAAGGGIQANDDLVITGSASNNGTKRVATVTATTITFAASETIVNEGPTSAPTVSRMSKVAAAVNHNTGAGDLYMEDIYAYRSTYLLNSSGPGNVTTERCKAECPWVCIGIDDEPGKSTWVDRGSILHADLTITSPTTGGNDSHGAYPNRGISLDLEGTQFTKADHTGLHIWGGGKNGGASFVKVRGTRFMECKKNAIITSPLCYNEIVDVHVQNPGSNSQGIHLYGGLARTVGASLTFNAAAKTVTRASGNFLEDGYQPDDLMDITGSASNNGTGKKILTVAALVITFVSAVAVVNEGPTSAPTLTSVTRRAGGRIVNYTCVDGSKQIYSDESPATWDIVNFTALGNVLNDVVTLIDNPGVSKSANGKFRFRGGRIATMNDANRLFRMQGNGELIIEDMLIEPTGALTDDVLFDGGRLIMRRNQFRHTRANIYLEASRSAIDAEIDDNIFFGTAAQNRIQISQSTFAVTVRGRNHMPDNGWSGSVTGAGTAPTGRMGFYPNRGADVASSATISLSAGYDTYSVTGTTQINQINLNGGGTASAWNQMMNGTITLIAAGAWALGTSGNVIPRGGSIRRMVSGEQVQLKHDPVAGKWREVGDGILPSTGTAPAEAEGAGAGAGATTTVTGGDLAFKVALTTGTGAGAGTLTTLTLSRALANPRAFLTPLNAAAAGVTGLRVTCTGGASPTVAVIAGGGLVDATLYEWDVLVVG